MLMVKIDMEMPSRCSDCQFSDLKYMMCRGRKILTYRDRKRARLVYSNFKEIKPKWCPLIECTEIYKKAEK